MSGRCVSCKHHQPWDEYDYRRDERMSGICRLSKSEDGMPLRAGARAYALDGESYVASLVVSHDFGCVQWERGE